MLTKIELRKEMSARRNGIPAPERREKSRRIAAHVLESPFFAVSKTIFLYMHIGTEVETGELAAAILSAGRILCVPWRRREEMSACRIYSLARDLSLSAQGILEPEPTRRQPVPPSELDMVLAPGLAFDRTGWRLGYGGGYYDRFLPLCRPEVLVCGLAFSCQILPHIVFDSHDRKMSCLVSEEGIYYTDSNLAEE
jgi:5-formyltetrahydrofolate cyclo-ligase